MGLEKSEIGDGPGGYQADVEVGEGDGDEAGPGKEAVAGVEDADALPEAVADLVAAGAGVAVEASTDKVAERVAGEGEDGYEEDIGGEDEGAEADAEVAVEVVRYDGGTPEDEDEEDREVEGEAMEVLEDEGELALAGVVLALGDLLDSAGGRVPEEGPVVGEAVVVAGEAEGKGEGEDVEGGGDIPAEDAEVEPEERGVEGRQVGAGLVVLVLQGPPGAVDDEAAEHDNGDQRLDPPVVVAGGEWKGCAPRFFALRGVYGHVSLLGITNYELRIACVL